MAAKKTMTPADLLALLLREAQGNVAAQVAREMESQTFVGGKRVRVQPLPTLPKAAATTVHQVKVTLYGAKPPVWRRLEIPSVMTLDYLHEVMQIAFDWDDCHLHSFETVYGEFGPAEADDDWRPLKDEASAALAQIAPAVRSKVVYTYDFGDDWRHDIVVEQILPAEPGVAYPRCTGGRRAAPPEDSGGIWAYNEDPGPEPGTFDAGEVTEALRDIAVVMIPSSGRRRSLASPATSPQSNHHARRRTPYPPSPSGISTW